MRDACLAPLSPLAGNCQAGYEGNLCGVCAPGYGMTSPFKCVKCLPIGRQWGMYALLGLSTLAFLLVTVHFTWQDNLKGDTTLRVSDLIKVLVLFLQYLGIVGGITVHWPDWLSKFFTSTSVVFGASSSYIVSPDCWLAALGLPRPPLAVQRQLVNLLVPICLACGVALTLFSIWLVSYGCGRAACINSCGRGNAAKRRKATSQSRPLVMRQLPIIAVVTLFYAYPTLTRTALSFLRARASIKLSGGTPSTEPARMRQATGFST
jgi:hypothetical protein